MFCMYLLIEFILTLNVMMLTLSSLWYTWAHYFTLVISLRMWDHDYSTWQQMGISWYIFQRSIFVIPISDYFCNFLGQAVVNFCEQIVKLSALSLTWSMWKELSVPHNTWIFRVEYKSGYYTWQEALHTPQTSSLNFNSDFVKPPRAFEIHFHNNELDFSAVGWRVRPKTLGFTGDGLKAQYLDCDRLVKSLKKIRDYFVMHLMCFLAVKVEWCSIHMNVRSAFYTQLVVFSVYKSYYLERISQNIAFLDLRTNSQITSLFVLIWKRYLSWSLQVLYVYVKSFALGSLGSRLKRPKTVNFE